MELHPSVPGQTNLAPLPHPFVLFYRYYINLCQKIYKGPLDCSDRASICKKSASGVVQVLGLVHTQKLDVIGEALGPCAWLQVSHQNWEGKGVLIGQEAQHGLQLKLPDRIPNGCPAFQ